MTPDLTYLVWAVALTIVQVLVASSGAMMQIDLPALAGNRDTPAEGRGWVGRAQRAHRNMLESLPLFAALVLSPHAGLVRRRGRTHSHPAAAALAPD
jgi:uncharacterized MAPEG superfamily protein